MKRKLIVMSTFFVIGLLATAFATFSLMMNLIEKPVEFTVNANGATDGETALLKQSKAALNADNKTFFSATTTLTLSAGVIRKPKPQALALNQPVKKD